MFTRTGTTWRQQAYVKASNTGAGDSFGLSVALSADGSTLAVGARLEDSAATGINGDQTSNAAAGLRRGLRISSFVTSTCASLLLRATRGDGGRRSRRRRIVGRFALLRSAVGSALILAPHQPDSPRRDHHAPNHAAGSDRRPIW